MSVEPLLSIGLVEGANEYLFAGINGGALLADGSVVVSDRAHFRIQKFGPDGEHLWSRGREGEGPGEFEYVLGPGCRSTPAHSIQQPPEPTQEFEPRRRHGVRIVGQNRE